MGDLHVAGNTGLIAISSAYSAGSAPVRVADRTE